MNIIFGIILLLSISYITITSPNEVLPTALAATNNALYLSIRLLVLFSFWLGIEKIIEESGLSKKIANFLSKPLRKILKSKNKESIKSASLNVSANMLGLGNIATPLGIRTIRNMNINGKMTYPMAMFFVLNATSLQLIPTTTLALLVSGGCDFPSKIILPSLLCSIIATCFGAILVRITVKND